MKRIRLRLRFTVRWLMIAVAFVGLLLGLVIERRSRFGKIARYHRIELEELITTMNSMAPDDPRIGRANWYGKMRDKYERAALYPWLPIEPDTPEPK